MLRNELFRPWFVGEKDWGVEIIDGEFSGVSIQIDKIEFSEKDEGAVQLEYNVIHKPESITDEDLKSEMFNSTMSLIINDVIKEAVEVAKNDESRDNNTQESNP